MRRPVTASGESSCRTFSASCAASLFGVSPEASLSAGVYSLDGGITWRPWQGLLSFGTLAPGATATLLVAGVVHPCAQGTITNTAVISSQTAGQSTAAVTTPVWPPQGYRPVWHGTGC